MKHGKKLTGLVMAGIMTAGVLTGCTNEPSANTASDTKRKIRVRRVRLLLKSRLHCVLCGGAAMREMRQRWQ